MHAFEGVGCRKAGFGGEHLVLLEWTVVVKISLVIHVDR